MTRKDYIKLAEAFREARDDIARKEPDKAQQDLQDGVSYAVDFVCEVLQRDNPRFNRARFRAACGVED